MGARPEAGHARALRGAGARGPGALDLPADDASATLEFREMQVDVHPHAYLGKVQGCSSWLSTGKSGFSTAAGIVPTFILDDEAVTRALRLATPAV